MESAKIRKYTKSSTFGAAIIAELTGFGNLSLWVKCV